MGKVHGSLWNLGAGPMTRPSVMRRATHSADAVWPAEVDLVA
jgi:hypothetical protein